MVDSIYTQTAYTPPDATGDKNTPAPDGEKEFAFFGDDGFTFLDFVDMINPLQHIPIISTAYREMTGDTLDPGARLAGGTLFGGPIGLAASTFNVVLEHNTGKDAGEHVVAWFDGDEVPVEEGQTMMAENETSQNRTVASSFAPMPIPESEAAAFAAGEASLRLAELQEFMNPALAREVPVQVTSQNNKAAGSAGVWAPPPGQIHPFPTMRAGEEPVLQKTPTPASAPVQNPPVEIIPQPQQTMDFQAKQTHEESLSALQAFARDMQAQRAQDQARQQSDKASSASAPIEPARAAHIPSSTSQLSQTQDNAWFANMMSQNMDRYQKPGIDG